MLSLTITVSSDIGVRLKVGADPAPDPEIDRQQYFVIRQSKAIVLKYGKMTLILKGSNQFCQGLGGGNRATKASLALSIT